MKIKGYAKLGGRGQIMCIIGDVQVANCLFLYTAISRKVVVKTVHATIPKGNMGYDQ